MAYTPSILLVVDPSRDTLGARLESLGASVTSDGLLADSSSAHACDAVVADAGALEAGRTAAERAGGGTALIALVSDAHEERACMNAGAEACVRCDAGDHGARLIMEMLARRRAERQAQRGAEELEEFLYVASHDMNAPLISVLGYLTHTRLALEAGDSAGAGEFAALAEQEAMRLSERIEGLRALSRVTLGREPATDLDLGELTERAWAMVTSRRAGGRVELCVEPGLPTLRGEEHTLRALLEALLENAFVHGCAGGGGAVRVGSHEREGETVFTVSDPSGELDAKHHERVFGLFIQVRKETGCGVGLAVARRAAQLYGGRAWIEAGEPGGCRACFTLPGCVSGARVVGT